MSRPERTNRRQLLALAAAAALWGALPGSARATTVLAMDLAELAAGSTALVVAVVGEATPIDTARGPYTDTALKVERVLGGEAPDTLAVRQLGGRRAVVETSSRSEAPGAEGSEASRDRMEVVEHHVSGDARLERGQRVVAFVRRVEGTWYLTALAQSVWHVDGDGPDAPIRRDLEGTALFQRDLAGRVVPADESLPAYATLGELTAACRGLRFGVTP